MLGRTAQKFRWPRRERFVLRKEAWSDRARGSVERVG